MKKIFYIIPVMLFAASGAFAQLATYAGSGGSSVAVTGIANETVTVLQTVGFGTNTPCGSGGKSGITVNTSWTSFSPAGPHAYIQILPNTGYQLNMSGFNAGMRCSGTGPACVSFAYSVDNGVTWTSDLGCHAPNNGGCGTTAVSSWSGGALPTAISNTTNGIIVAIFPYNASNSSGTFQINTINIAGTVTPANTPPSFVGGTTQTLSACENTASSINSIMSITDPNVGQTETWTVLSAPAHGTLGGFSTTATSTGSAITPTALTYTPATGYTGTDVYAIQVSDGTAIATTTVTVTVNPTPVATPISGTTAVCVGATTQLSNAAPGGTWISSNTSVATVDATGLLTGLSPVSSAISYIVTSSCGTVTSSVTVTVNPLPATYILTGGGFYCAGGSGAHIGAVSSDLNVSYQLYFGGASIGMPVPGTGSPIDFGLQTGVGNYTVIAMNTITGCTNNMPGSVSISTFPAPVPYSITGGGPSCSGAGVHVGLSTSDIGVNYQLYNGSAAFGSVLAGTGSALDFGLIFAGGTYTVVGTNSHGCITTMTGSTLIAVTASVTPAVSITTGVGDTVCAGSALTFTAIPVHGGLAPAYQWYANGFPTATGSTYNYTPVNGDIISTTLTSNADCATVPTASATAAMTVNPNEFPAVAATIAPDNIICEGSSATFTAHPTYGGLAPVYLWVVNNVTVGSGASYTYIPANNDIVYCRMSSNFTCRQADTVASSTTIVTTQSVLLPIVTVTANPLGPVTAGQTITFRADIVNGGSALPTYQWYLNGVPVPGATTLTYAGNTFNPHDSVTCAVTTLSGTCDATGFGWIYADVHPLGVSTINGNNNDVHVVPNPNKGDFTISGSFGAAASEEVTIELVNILGQVIYSTKATTVNGSMNEHIQLTDFINGMYLLNVHSSSARKAFHLVMNR